MRPIAELPPLPAALKLPNAVLVVDDDRATRLLTLRWLARSGLTLLEAERGEEALAVLAARADEVAVVVLDVMMPGLDGYEVLARLRGSPSTSAIPVVLLTAHATQDEDVVRGVTGGAVDHLSKPYDGLALVERVSALAAERRERLRARASAP